jgi:hypothetical protein
MTTVADAIAIAKRALPNASFGLRALVVAIGGLESHWGDGWSVTNQWSEGISGTNNWGAITAGPSWTGATFEHVDHRIGKNGAVEQYTTTFRKYPTPEAGAADLGQLLQHQYAKAVAAAESGNWPAVSKVLYDGGYYSTTIADPKKAVAVHYGQLRKFLLEQGISAPLLAAAAGIEWLFWAGIAAIIVARKAKRR